MTTDSVVVAADPGGTFTLGGLSEQVEFAGAPLQLTATVCENFASGVREIVEVPVAPGATLMVLGEADILKFGPDPVSVTFCEPPVALSVMFIVADSGPYTLGVRLTLMVQVSSGEIVAGRVVPHVLVCEKSPAFVPEKVGSLVKLRSSPPVLLNVTGCELPVTPNAHCPRARVVGVAVAAGANGT